MADVKVEIRGLEQSQAKMKQVAEDIHGGAVYSAMQEATQLVTRDAKILAPVDTGRLRASITPEVRTDGKVLEGVVGSNVEYAAPMEVGTGTPAGHSPHYPPPDALETWATRHGFKSGMQVAKIIWKRGGLMGRHFLQRGFDQNKEAIQKLLEDAVSKAVNK